jgi:hypothetical protein
VVDEGLDEVADGASGAGVGAAGAANCGFGVSVM